MDRIDGTNPLSTSRTLSGAPPQGASARTEGRDATGATTERQDNVRLSNRAHDVAQASRAVADSAEVREARVAELKAAIANGTYDVDARAIAERLLATGFGQD